jgi:hypothetical protein
MIYIYNKHFIHSVWVYKFSLSTPLLAISQWQTSFSLFVYFEKQTAEYEGINRAETIDKCLSSFVTRSLARE